MQRLKRRANCQVLGLESGNSAHLAKRTTDCEATLANAVHLSSSPLSTESTLDWSPAAIVVIHQHSTDTPRCIHTSNTPPVGD